MPAELRALLANAVLNISADNIKQAFWRYDLDEIYDTVESAAYQLTKQACLKSYGTLDVMPRGTDGKLPEDFLRYRAIRTSSRTAREARNAKRYARYLSRRTGVHNRVARPAGTPAL